MQRLDKVFSQTAARKVEERPSYHIFCEVTQNPHFLKNCKGGTKGNFSKSAQESTLFLKRLIALWRKWHYPSISMLLTCKDWRRFWRIRRLQKCPNGQVMAIFGRRHNTPYFLKKCKGGTKGNFSKIAQKVALA